jgi:cystathionine gamma-synthase
MVFSSGMAAANAVMDILEPGTHVIAPSAVYTGVGVRLRELAQRGVITLSQVDAANTQEIVDLLRRESPHGLCLWLESPTNPLLEVMDLEHLLAAAKSVGGLSVVDNTFATPARQQPIALGADVVLHSVTKALSGHSDLLMGALVTNDEELAEEFRIRRVLLGAAASAFDAFLALRGLRTLGVRVDRSETTARDLADRLATHPKVTKVRYPGWGSLISIEVNATPAGIDSACGDFSVWTFATSLGGVESLVERRRRWPLESSVVPENLMRLSVGLEHPDDLWADLLVMLDHA